LRRSNPAAGFPEMAESKQLGSPLPVNKSKSRTGTPIGSGQ
jgi:hypothetical protein